MEVERREKERLAPEHLEQENERLVSERREKDRLETARLEAERKTRLAALAQVREQRARAQKEDLEAEQRQRDEKERLAAEQRKPWALLTSLLVVTLQRKSWALIVPLVVFVLILVVGLIRFARRGGPPDATLMHTQAPATRVANPQSNPPVPGSGLEQASFYKSRGAERLSNRLYSIAMSDFDEAIKLNPKDGQSYYNRGVCHQGLDQDAEAKADFDKAKNLGYSESPPPTPDRASFYKSRGAERLSNRLYSIAMSDFDEAIKLNPKDGESYYNRGLCHQGLDQDADANADFDKARQLGYTAH